MVWQSINELFAIGGGGLESRKSPERRGGGTDWLVGKT